MVNTHVITSNGSIKIEVSEVRGPEKVLGRALSMLDGDTRFALSLAKLPEGVSLADKLPPYWPESFLQSAGSADRMTIELRTAPASSDGIAEHAVVGRAHEDVVEQVTVAWPGGTQAVTNTEVFGADEATRLYMHYYEHGELPAGYVTRPLQG